MYPFSVLLVSETAGAVEILSVLLDGVKVLVSKTNETQ